MIMTFSVLNKYFQGLTIIIKAIIKNFIIYS